MTTSIKRPSSTDFNEAADYWRYVVNANVIPADSRGKTTFITWAKSGYQDNPISEEQHNEWKQTNAFANGMAVITGLIRMGEHEGLYLNCVDCDNRLAIDSFYLIDGNKPASLQHIANVFLVEQHRDSENKCHIFFYSTIPITAKSSSANTVGKEKLDNNELPAYEIKATSKTIVYCTPSFHQGGHQYEFIGNCTIPPILNETQSNELMQHLDKVHKKYGMAYLDNADGKTGKSMIPITELKKPDFEILEGNNRHEALLRIMESRIVKLRGEVPPEEIRELCYVWNQQHCKPPLDDNEFEKQWIDAVKFVARKDAEKLEQEKLEHEQRVQRLLGKKLIGVTQLPQPDIPIAWKNDYFEYLVWCAQKEVKQENALIRQIMLTILSAYGSDPSNLGIMAPTSTGKSWPVNKCIMYTPGGKEVRTVASMTPKVLVREKGVLVDKDNEPIGKEVRKLKGAIKIANGKKKFDEAGKLQEELEVLLEDSAYIINLSGMVLIFLEPPHPDLWNLLKPILSHDSWEMEHPFVDNIGHGIEVKRVITRGWPSCVFCSAKDESKWEVWPEIESRFAISSPNIIKIKFEEGNKLIWQNKWLPRSVKQQRIISDEEIKRGKSCFLYLKHQTLQYKEKTDSPVWAPFGEYVGTAFPSDRGQDNRAFNRFTTMLNTIALCKAHLRYKMLFGREELIIPSLRDLQETLHVLQNMTGLPPHKLNFYKDYIYKLWEEKGSLGSLTGKEIVDYYNKNNPDKRHPMNGENLRNNYLKELVNHSYLEQEQDDAIKAVRYLYTPLIQIENKAPEQQQPKEEQQKQQEEKPLTDLILESIINKLQYSKLVLPKSHKGIPSDWLNQQILELSKSLSTLDQLILLSPDGKVVSTEEFIEDYERDVKLDAFITTPEVNKAP